MKLVDSASRGFCYLLLIICAQALADRSAPGPATDPSTAVDTSRWQCALCPYRFGWYGKIDIGPGWVSDASNKFGDYRGLEDQGAFLALDGSVHFRDESGRYLDVRATDLGIDSRRIQANGGQRGRYALDLGYQEIPKYRGYGTRTVYEGVGGSNLTLPAGWQTAPSTSAMGALSESLRPVDLQITRKVFDAGLSWKLDQRWTYDAQYQHQAKEGTRAFGAGVFNIDSSHLPVPVDFSTDRLDLGLNFNGQKAHWRIGFSGSAFNNANSSITWENPFTAIPGTESLQASLAPDNRSYQVNLAGAWAANHRLRVSASAAIGRMEQNEVLLPYSINPNFNDLPLPRHTANARIDAATVNLAGKLSARLSRRLDLNLRLRHEDRDNKTPVDTWTPVISELVERVARPNRPYSFKRDRAWLTFRYRPRSSLRLQAGGEWEDYERTLQSVMSTKEIGWFAEVSVSPGSIVELRARLEQSQRDAGPYLQVEDFALPEHPLLRKFNLADRDRRLLRLDLDFFPIPDLAVNLAYRNSHDEYDESFIGLLESEERSISLDLSWNAGEEISSYLFLSFDDYDSDQAGGESGTDIAWLATTDDAFFTAGIGFTAQLNERAELGIDYLVSNSEGDIRTESGAGEPPFPTLETRLRNARLRFGFQATEHWGLLLALEHEKYDSTDWALDGFGPAGIPAVLTFGADSPDYSVTVVRAQAVYRF